MKQIMIVLIILSLFSFASAETIETQFQRFNNLTIYQNPQFNYYKVSLFTNLVKGKYFLTNIYDTYINSNGQYQSFYTVTTAGKYITKKISFKIQYERLNNSGFSRYSNNYYVGLGVDF